MAQPSHGGVGRCLESLVVDQVERGWQVTVACDGGSMATTLAEAGAGVEIWSATRMPGPGTIPETTRLNRIVSRARPDVLHLHSAKAGLAGRLAVRGRIPTVYQPHAWSFDAVSGITHRATCSWERIGARWTDWLLCVSHAERERGVLNGIESASVVVHNGIDLARSRSPGDEERALARLELGIGPDPLVVCMGRLTRQKGQDVLLDAWRVVRRSVPAARLALVGDGPLGDAIQRRQDSGVLLAGSTDDPWTWYAASDVVVVPSRWEGLALVPLEAHAAGRTVVATDVTGMRECVPPGSGRLVPAESPRPLAQALTHRLRDPGLCRTEGAAGRADVSERFTVTRAVEQVAQLYGRVLRARTVAGAAIPSITM